MKEELIERIYIKVYFWTLLIVQTLMVISSDELGTVKGTVNVIFFYLSFIPLYGYAYQKKTASQSLWKIFAPAFFLWQTACFFYLYPNPYVINVMLVIMLAPLYWGVAMYFLITMEADENKRTEMAAKRNNVKEKFKSFFVICSALALLLLILSFVVMIRNI